MPHRAPLSALGPGPANLSERPTTTLGQPNETDVDSTGMAPLHRLILFQCAEMTESVLVSTS